MNILLTRPLIDTENLMRELLIQGHKIIHLPTLQIINLDLPPIHLDKYFSLIFTSANSVRNLKVIGDKSKIICYCVGSITEKLARSKGFTNTVSAGGTAEALKNLIFNSIVPSKDKRLAYICGDQTSIDLDQELSKEGHKVDKIVNYKSKKISNINDANVKLIENYPPNLIFVYSLRSAESFIDITNNYSLAPMMTQSIVMCISNKIKNYFLSLGWKKIATFDPGNEIFEIEKKNECTRKF